MIPIEFDEQNGELTKPAGMTDEQCRSLPCFTNGQQVISRWQMTWRERFKAVFSGKVWVSVWSGRSSPPIAISVDTPFLSYTPPAKAEPASYSEHLIRKARGNGAKW